VGWPTSVILSIKVASWALVAVVDDGAFVAVACVDAVVDEVELPVDVLEPQAANTSKRSSPKSIIKDV
jgi:hypothetical protein